MTDDNLERLKLRKEIVVDGKTLDVVSFREPTADDIEEFGIPFTVTRSPTSPVAEMKFDGEAMTGLMARISGVPVDGIRQLHVKDWNNWAWKLGTYLHNQTTSIDERILDCYRLGKFFGVDPCIFLAKPISEIIRHVYWMGVLNERSNTLASIDD